MLFSSELTLIEERGLGTVSLGRGGVSNSSSSVVL